MFGDEEAWDSHKVDMDIARAQAISSKNRKKKEDTASSDSESDSDDERKKTEPKGPVYPKRVTTVMVHSLEAEIWGIPRKVQS